MLKYDFNIHEDSRSSILISPVGPFILDTSYPFADLVASRSSFAFTMKAVPHPTLSFIQMIVSNPTRIIPNFPHPLVRGCDFETIKIPYKPLENG